MKCLIVDWTHLVLASGKLVLQKEENEMSVRASKDMFYRSGFSLTMIISIYFNY